MTIKGMLKLDRKIDIGKASKILAQSKKDLRHFIYTAAAKSEFTGKFEGNEFILDETEGSVENFIDALEKQFASWTNKESGKSQKKI